MAISDPVLSDVITQYAKLAAELVEMKGTIDRLQVQYDAAGGFKQTITPEQEGEIAETFYGLTKTELDDGAYVITGTLQGILDTAFTQLVKLAVRYR
jgi:hypothetical protein